MIDDRRAAWDARHRDRPPGPPRPEPFLLAVADLLPQSGRALDVAGGAGDSARWLAGLGLDVTLADWSEVALGKARCRLRALAVDLERDPLPVGPWDLMTCFRFLHRPLFDAFPTALAQGGLLVVVHPTASNLARHPRPGRHHLLDDGELPGLLRGLEILRSEEGWGEDGRHEARVIARRGDLP